MGEPVGIHAGATADVENGRWRWWQVTSEELLRPHPFEPAPSLEHPVPLDPLGVVLEDLLRHGAGDVLFVAHATLPPRCRSLGGSMTSRSIWLVGSARDES